MFVLLVNLIVSFCINVFLLFFIVLIYDSCLFIIGFGEVGLVLKFDSEFESWLFLEKL